MIGIFLVPIIVSAFSVVDYGIIDGIRVISTFASAFLILGLQQACARYMSDEKDGDEKRRIVGDTLILSLIAAMLGAAAIFAFAGLAISFFFQIERADAVFGLRAVALYIPLGVLLAFFQMLLKWNFARKKFVFLSIINAVSLLGLTYLFGVKFQYGIRGVFAAQFLATACSALIGVCFCRRYIQFGRSGVKYSDLLKFGFPLMGVQCLAAAYPLIERFILVRVVGLEGVGIVGLAHSYSRLINMPAKAFEVSWPPFALALLNERDAHKTFNSVLQIYVIVTMGLYLVAIMLAKPLLNLIVSADYMPSAVVAMPLAFGYLIGSLRDITGIGTFLAKKTYLEPIAFSLSLLVSVVAMLMLAEDFGVMGFAYSFLLGKIFYSAISTVFAYAVHSLRFRLTPVVAICGVAFMIAYYFL